MSFDAASLRRLSVETADDLARALWAGCFSLIGLFNRSALDLRAIDPSGGSSVLVVAPHPDDEALGCGVAISLHVECRDTVHVVIVTDGQQATSATPNQRAAEAQRAALALGTSCRMLDLPEGAWRREDGVAALYQVLIELQPAIVYAPSLVDYHPEHARVASALAIALERFEAMPVVRVYEVGVPLTPALVNRVAELGDGSRKDAALAAYASQARTIAPIRRLHRYNRLLYRRRAELEVFCEMAAGDYVRVSRTMARDTRPLGFHGVRGRAFRDPLCYLIGLRGRLRVARIAYREA